MSNKVQFSLLLIIFSLTSLASSFAFYGDIPTDENFTISAFVGDWNVVGVYGIPDVTNHSCPTLKAKSTLLSSLTMSFNAINISNSDYITSTKVYQQSTSNKGILVDILSPLHPQDLAVSYFNATAGQALLININALYALALAKVENIYLNNFLETVNDILLEAQIPLNQTVFTSQYGCTTSLSTALNFNVSNFQGKYYGNAMFSAAGNIGDLKCFNIQVQDDPTQSNIFNISATYQYSTGTVSGAAAYVPTPDNAAFLINIDPVVKPSIVVNHYDPGNDLYILLTHDAQHGVVISSKQILEGSTITYVQDILERDGLTINSTTFYIPTDLCPLGNNLIDF